MCSLQDFSRALYPLAVRRRAPRWLTFWPWPWPWPWPSYGSGSPPAARTRRVWLGCLALRKSRVHCEIGWHLCSPRRGSRRRLDHFLELDMAAELRGRRRRRRLASESDGPALTCCDLHARARRSRGRRRPIFFFESGWRRSGSVRRRRRAQRATGSTSPPAACTGKLMGLGRVLALRFQPCTLSVGGTAPSAALAYFLALAVAVELGGQHRRRPLAPGGSSRSENRECIESASERARVNHLCDTTRAREAEPSPPPADFLFANLVGGAAGVFGGGAERSELRGRRRRRWLAPAS